MSTNEEQLKKLNEEEQNKKEVLESALEQEIKDKERKETVLAATEEEQQVDQESYFTPSPNTNENDWEKILEAYKKKYPDKDRKDNSLTFPTREDAINFFQQQATESPPHKFFATEIGANGEPTGFNVFSCGDGQLYKGTLNEIQDQLKEANKEKPDDPNIKEGLATIARALNPDQHSHAALKETKKNNDDFQEAPKPKPRGREEDKKDSSMESGNYSGMSQMQDTDTNLSSMEKIKLVNTSNTLNSATITTEKPKDDSSLEPPKLNKR
jgi:uncharacterized protein YrzB (UPF0473 family)